MTIETARCSDQRFEEAYRFIIKLGTVAHGCGVSSFRLESYLSRVTEAFGLKGEFIVTPNYVSFVLWHPGELEQHSHLAKMAPSSLNMAKLAKVGELVGQIENGMAQLVDGTVALDKIDGEPPQYGRLPIALAYVMSAAGFAVLLSASQESVLLAAILSLVAYAVVLLAGNSRWLTFSLELSVGVLVSIVANVVATFVPGSDPFTVTLCAMIMLIPGLPLTLGLAELSSKHVVSGMSRVMEGVVTTLKLFVGAAIGSTLVNTLLHVPATDGSGSIPAVWTWMFATFLVVGLAIDVQVRPKDFAWTLLGGVLAYAGTVFGAQFGFWQGSFIGAMALGIYANLFSWRLNRPTSIVLLPAVLVLVPGASAYRGLHTAETTGMLAGLSAEWQVLVSILAIITGIIVSYSIIPPKASL